MLNITILVIILVTAIVLIYVYGRAIKANLPGSEDVFKGEFLGPGTELSMWSVFHFILFLLLGYLAAASPTNSYAWICFLILLGVGWEVLEHLLSTPESRQRLFGVDWKEDAYWYAKVTDIAADVLGLMAGVALYRYSHRH